MSFTRGVRLLALLGVVVAAPACSAAVVEDNFAGTTLNPAWATVVPLPGPTVTVNNGLNIALPAGGNYDNWVNNRRSPRVYLPAPDGDFTVTAHVASITDAGGNPVAANVDFHAGIIVSFAEGEDVVIHGPYRDPAVVRAERTGTGYDSAAVAGIPVWVRIRKVGTTYHFEYRDEGTTDADWQEIQLADGSGPSVKTITEKPLHVGLTGKAWGANQALTFKYDHFKLDAPTIPQYGFIAGTVPNGYSLTVQALDAANKVIASTTVAPDGTYRLGVLPGAYTVQIVNDPERIESPAAGLTKAGVNVAAGATAATNFDASVLPVQNLGSPFLPADAWKFLSPVEAGDYAAGAENFDDSGFTPVLVPSNLEAIDGGDNTDHIYRVKFSVPDAWVGKDLILYGFDEDDGVRALFLNGQNLGSYTEAGGGFPNPWTVQQKFVLPGSAVKKNNTLAIFGRQGGGGAGIVNNWPKLHPMYTQSAIIKGRLVSSAGTPISGTLNLLDSTGKVVATGYSSGPVNGTFLFGPVAPGSYTFSDYPTLYGGGPNPITVTAGQILTLPDLSPAGISLASSALPAGSTGWKVGVVEANDFAAGAENFDDSALADVTVPSSINGGVVADNQDFVYRIKFSIPDAWVGKALVISGFEVDDGVNAFFFNGQNLGSYTEAAGGYANPWGVQQTYVIPANLVKKDNTVALFGHQGGGGAGLAGSAPLVIPMWTTRGAITGKVTNAQGQPTSAAITLLDASGNVAFSGFSSGPINGTFTLHGLAPGTYTLDQFSVQLSGAPASITVTAGGIVNLPTFVSQLPPFFEDATPRPTDDTFSGTALDPKWTKLDVGDAMPGAAAPADGLLNVTAGGSNIWDIRDGFNFVYQSIPGDFSATLKVVAVPDNRDWQIGGLMVRKSLDPTSPHAYMQVSPRHEIQDKNRPNPSSVSTDNPIAGTNGATLLSEGGVWVKIKKQGTRFAYYYTTDPADPTKTVLGHVFNFPSMNDASMFVGIASSAQNAGLVDEGYQYDDFRVIPAATVVPPVCTKGDANGDRQINVNDAVAILRHATSIQLLTGQNRVNADIDGAGATDASVNVADAVKVLQFIVGIPGTGITACQ